jgi:DNA modification methylase
MKLLLGDCLDKLKELDDNSVDSIVTDPPYGLSFMGKKWDYDVPSQTIWEECMRVLKPGGHLLSFAGSRTYHRMAVRIEDAGFEIRDQIMWIYGSGFPKSHNIGKALDKNNGNNNLVSEVADKLKEARESRGISKGEADKLFCNGTTNYSWLEGRKGGVRLPEDALFQKIVDEWPELEPYQQKVKSANREVIGQYEGDSGGLGGERLGSKGGDITIPSTDVAKDWEGWGTALKPAHEPIVMARKPIVGTVANNVLEWGTGGINIEETRIPYKSKDDMEIRSNLERDVNKLGDGNFGGGKYSQPVESGRFPANIIFDEEAGKILDEQTINDKKGASRFFYCPKTSKSDRNVDNIHPTVKPTDLMAYLVRLVTPKGGVVLDPFMGSGSTGKAAVREGMQFVGIERESEYFDIAKARIQNEIYNTSKQTKVEPEVVSKFFQF